MTPVPLNNRVGRSFVSAAQSSLGKCHDFNNGLCTWLNCHFSHTCEMCGQSHAKVECPIGRGRGQSVNRQSFTPRSTFRGSNYHFPKGRGSFRNFRGNYGRGFK